MTARRFRRPAGRPEGTVAVPGDKSLSHRALILGGMAAGASRIAGLGPGADVAASASCLRALGVAVDGGAIVSPGVAGWVAPGAPLDAANSGTTLRLLAGALSGRPFVTVLTGDASLRARPMRRLVGPLAALGARVEVSATGTAPLTVIGGELKGAAITIPVASAQVRTAVALAALQATGATTVDSPPGFRDHTERWLGSLGLGAMLGATRFRIDPGPVPPLDLLVPGDPSSAAFLWAAAVLADGAVTTPGVSLNPGRLGFLDILRTMGVSVAVTTAGEVLGDPVGTVTVAGAPDRPAAVRGDVVASALDELPLVGLVAAVAPGVTSVGDAGELRVKESDRIAATVAMVSALGGTAVATEDGFVITGGRLAPGTVDAGGDHRIALASAVAAAAAGEVEVVGWEASAVSWPGFEEAWEALWS